MRLPVFVSALGVGDVIFPCGPDQAPDSVMLVCVCQGTARYELRWRRILDWYGQGGREWRREERMKEKPQVMWLSACQETRQRVDIEFWPIRDDGNLSKSDATINVRYGQHHSTAPLLLDATR
jgi:hypothetical protein